MFKKINNRGSSLILLIFVVSILSLLGVTLMATSMTNLKISKKNTIASNNFYSSESGLDEIYALSMKIYDTAYHDSHDFIMILDAALNNYSKDGEFTSLCHPDGSQVTETEFITILNKPFYDDALDDEFKKYFESKYLLDYREYLMANNLDYDDSKLLYSSNSIKPTIALASVPGFSSNELTLQVKSSYMSEGISRSTYMDLVIATPDISTVITEESIYTEIDPYNPLLERPLVVQGDLYLDGDIEVYGDIIIFGDLIAEDDFNMNMNGYNLAVYGSYDTNSKEVSISDVNELYLEDSSAASNIDSISWSKDKESDEFRVATLGLGVYEAGGSFISQMEAALENIGEDAKNVNKSTYDTMSVATVIAEDIQPIQLLYDLSGMNNTNDPFQYSDIFYSSNTSNENEKSLDIYGYPYQGTKKNQDYYVSEQGTTIVVDGDVPSSVKINYESVQAGVGCIKGVFLATGEINVTGSTSIEGSLLAFDDIHLDAENESITLTNTPMTNLTQSVYSSDDKAAVDLENAFKPALKYIDELPTEKVIDEIVLPEDQNLIHRENWSVTYD
ncbi:hypothetical protein SAMN02745751_00818 [Dethiosulfatibacter aminovorans DSM 17477]|uniref:PilX N-terminal n=1 Tax=Dethiosulfatibacter aminovorans DSM 17477 TaxID=1121476 RepID=A0A1M6D8A8_9FIRM|nr:pilus assembly PilX N-terminal domain-containing protein [Dethiosulfatibacter aminovorans]SHI69467.1 hypothetical protein SAMN02745751_00818 [Dethiosulfatibacter aminovorans DSM 17477]